MIKRTMIFLLTNLAAVLMLTFVASLVCALLGIDLSRSLGEGGWEGLFVFAFIFGMAGSVISLFLSKTMVKVSMRCRTIKTPSDDAERWLVSTVASLAEKAGVKMPEVAIYPGEANAFATGAFKNHALVAVSTRIMEQMSREELRAVLAHEMSHVANGDMVTMSLTQGVVNTFVIFFSHVLATIVSNAGKGENNRRRGGSYGMYYMLVQLFQMLFGILSSLVLFWYSRKREYAADAGSAHLLGSPSPMIAALRRLDNLQPGILPESIKAFGITGRKKTSLFATHPSIDDRIEALMNLPPSYAAV